MVWKDCGVLFGWFLRVPSIPTCTCFHQKTFVTLSSGLETGGAVVHAPETGTVTEGPVLVPHADGDPIPGKNNHSVWVTSLPVPILQSWNEVSMQYNLALFPSLPGYNFWLLAVCQNGEEGPGRVWDFIVWWWWVDRESTLKQCLTYNSHNFTLISFERTKRRAVFDTAFKRSRL